MTNPFAGAFDPPSPESLLPSPLQSVQSSLYQRLRRSHGRQAGTVGWLLIRAAQPKHRHHNDALAALSALGLAALESLTATVRATLAAPAIASRPESALLARAILDAIEAIKGEREGAAMVAAMSPEDRERMAARFRKAAGVK